MYKVTKILSTKDGKRANIYLNGEYFFTLEIQSLTDFGLYVDAVLDEEKIQLIKNADLENSLYRKSIEKLSRRLNSSHEIETYLKKILRKEVGETLYNEGDVIQDVINKLIEHKFIDDFAFVEWFYDIKKNKKSANEIKVELMRKGIESSLVDSFLSSKEKDDGSLLKELIIKKRRLLDNGKYQEKEIKNKIIQFLLRKGFNYGEIVENL